MSIKPQRQFYFHPSLIFIPKCLPSHSDFTNLGSPELCPNWTFPKQNSTIASEWFSAVVWFLLGYQIGFVKSQGPLWQKYTEVNKINCVESPVEMSRAVYYKAWDLKQVSAVSDHKRRLPRPLPHCNFRDLSVFIDYKIDLSIIEILFLREIIRCSLR